MDVINLSFYTTNKEYLFNLFSPRYFLTIQKRMFLKIMKYTECMKLRGFIKEVKSTATFFPQII